MYVFSSVNLSFHHLICCESKSYNAKEAEVLAKGISQQIKG
jgi:hypothetical protein